MTSGGQFRIGVQAFSSPGIFVAPGQLSFDNWIVEANPAPRTIEVSRDGTKPLASIQSGIDQARPGDTVLVYPGTYRENLDFLGKDITVTSLFGRSSDPAGIDGAVIDGAVIDGGANGRPIVTFASREISARLVGFTLTNGAASFAMGSIRIDGHSVARYLGSLPDSGLSQCGFPPRHRGKFNPARMGPSPALH